VLLSQVLAINSKLWVSMKRLRPYEDIPRHWDRNEFTTLPARRLGRLQFGQLKLASATFRGSASQMGAEIRILHGVDLSRVGFARM
jgi:hypothetical protein